MHSVNIVVSLMNNQVKLDFSSTISGKLIKSKLFSPSVKKLLADFFYIALQ